MAADVDLVLLHNGPHDSAGDLTLSDWIFLIVIVLALIGIGAAIWHVVQRRRGGPGT